MTKCFVPYTFLIALLLGLLVSCGSSGNGNDDDYVEVPVSPVVMDLAAVPYASLRDYNFFDGDLKNLQPVYGVLPYDLNSSLFTDYAKKKRFVWMPAGTHATYNSDGTVLSFPTGTALIKTFYYDNIAADGSTAIIETRVMIKKDTGWIFAGYVWNADMTEATLSTAGSTRPISWYEGEDLMTVNYKIPAPGQCVLCHKLNDIPTPVGPKPQNLNKSYAYSDGTKNQLSKWVEFGYLNSVPPTVTATIDWTDTTKPLALRARSYLDINCAHCHTQGAYCSYTPMDLAFNKTDIDANLGMCVTPIDFVSGNQTYIITKQNAPRSLLYYRMKTNIQSEMMPLIGRTVAHYEAVDLIGEWIDSMEEPCP